MNLDIPTTTVESQPEEELDEPYVHTVSTQEFVEAVEKASKEEDV